MDKILENINRASIKFLEPLTPEELYKTIVEEVIKLVKAEYGSILLVKNGEFKRVYASSPLAYQTINRKRGNTYKAFTTGKVIISDIQEAGRYHPELKKLGIKTSVFIPLSYQRKAIGVLTVNSTKKIPQTANELKILRLFGSFATLAIRKMQLYDETKKALETRDLFIALASHELRTPLTSLNGYIQLLHNKLGNKETQEAKWVRELFAESTRLTNLVKELLEINRIKQGQLQFSLRECSLRDVINQAIGRIKFANPEREVIFINKIPGGDDQIIGDPDKLLQMFSAFFSNAVKFSLPDAPIMVELEKINDLIIVKITDQGEGIEPSDLPHIFEEFYKSPRNYREGMGIGLILAKHIIQYHKGDVKVHSKPQKGTTIEIKFPVIEIE